jgi:hypothetical protein
MESNRTGRKIRFIESGIFYVNLQLIGLPKGVNEGEKAIKAMDISANTSIQKPILSFGRLPCSQALQIDGECH